MNRESRLIWALSQNPGDLFRTILGPLQNHSRIPARSRGEFHTIIKRPTNQSGWVFAIRARCLPFFGGHFPF